MFEDLVIYGQFKPIFAGIDLDFKFDQYLKFWISKGYFFI